MAPCAYKCSRTDRQRTERTENGSFEQTVGGVGLICLWMFDDVRERGGGGNKWQVVIRTFPLTLTLAYLHEVPNASFCKHQLINFKAWSLNISDAWRGVTRRIQYKWCLAVRFSAEELKYVGRHVASVLDSYSHLQEKLRLDVLVIAKSAMICWPARRQYLGARPELMDSDESGLAHAISSDVSREWMPMLCRVTTIQGESSASAGTYTVPSRS